MNGENSMDFIKRVADFKSGVSPWIPEVRAETIVDEYFGCRIATKPSGEISLLEAEREAVKRVLSTQLKTHVPINDAGMKELLDSVVNDYKSLAEQQKVKPASLPKMVEVGYSVRQYAETVFRWYNADVEAAKKRAAKEGRLLKQETRAEKIQELAEKLEKIVLFNEQVHALLERHGPAFVESGKYPEELLQAVSQLTLRVVRPTAPRVVVTHLRKNPNITPAGVVLAELNQIDPKEIDRGSRGTLPATPSEESKAVAKGLFHHRMVSFMSLKLQYEFLADAASKRLEELKREAAIKADRTPEKQ